MLMSATQRAARLRYGPNGFQMLAQGDHVVCARSGVRIPLDQLRYWSVDRQEAYASCELAVEAITGASPAKTA